ncbi:MAG: hypothetical protein ABIM88_02635 [candidate division WOR-3 bacterium]
MRSIELIREALRLNSSGDTSAFERFLEEMRNRDPLAYRVFEARLETYGFRPVSAIKKAVRLLTKVNDEPELAEFLFRTLGTAYRYLAELDIAKTYFLRSKEIGEAIGNQRIVDASILDMAVIDFMKMDYKSFYDVASVYSTRDLGAMSRRLKFYLGIYETMIGDTKRALEIFREAMESLGQHPDRIGVMEMMGLSYRISGNLSKSLRMLEESCVCALDRNSSYAIYPLSKALEITRLSGLSLSNPNIIRRTILNTPREQNTLPAIMESEALLNNGGDSAERLLEAARLYLSIYQNTEALFCALTGAVIAWREDSPVFTKLVRLSGPLIQLHPNIRKDPLLKDICAVVDTLNKNDNSAEMKGLKAQLIGSFKVWLDGKEMPLQSLGRRSSLLALVYLLLNPKHRIPADHLFHLLWPKRNYDKRGRVNLYVTINSIRKALSRDIIAKRGDFYCLQDVRTDLEELEEVVRLLSAARDESERVKLFERARELSRDDLLPEFPYDPYIDEYRQYYRRLREMCAEESARL